MSSVRINERKSMVRFLHTSDWQLGMGKPYFSEGTLERFTQARFDAVSAIGRVASEEGCSFVLVCGDAFESNQVDRRTVVRAAEALRQVPVPVFILPGNHDPLNAASVYLSSAFNEHKPENVTVIENSDPIMIGKGIELVGAPWFAKKPDENPTISAVEGLEPVEGVTRILIGHGIVDAFSPDKDVLDIIPVDLLERAISENKVHYVALGDRHSLTRVGSGERIWYSGTPEAADFSEAQPGFVLIVEVDASAIDTRAVQVGQWRFTAREIDLNTVDDIEALRSSLDEVEHKEMAVVKLSLVGSLSLSLNVVLQAQLDWAMDVFAAFIVKDDDLAIIPDDADFEDLGFSGFADAAVKRLREEITDGGEEEVAARDALMLLMRLAGGAT
ncbi:MAG: DNA repair exonuclease [Anaerolineae bacterium]|nr:DNA repair exonuclease [Anaerolineae bacterium]